LLCPLKPNQTTAKILYESAWHQGKCLACQSDWFAIYAYSPNTVSDFQIKERRLARKAYWAYSK